MLTWVETSRSALLHNLRLFKKSYPRHAIIPVIKSNAYGTGLDLAAKVIKNETKVVAVVSLREALRSRKILPNHRILTLSIIEPELLEEAIEQGIELPVYNAYWLKKIEQAARSRQQQANIHLKIDVGTHRIGFTPQEMPTVTESILKNKLVGLRGIFSHYAASEELPDFTAHQTKQFDQTIRSLNLPDKIMIHMACSAAGLIGEVPKTSNALRIGIGLYGYWPSQETHQRAPSGREPRPSLAWKTRIVHLQDLNKGDYVGYGCSYEVKRPMKIATVPIGYFDGYPRALSNKGYMLVGGERCKVRGRICMNLTMIDVTKVSKVNIGDEVTVMGKQGKGEITAEDLAGWSGTINYEIVSRINPAIPRKLVQ